MSMARALANPHWGLHTFAQHLSQKPAKACCFLFCNGARLVPGLDNYKETHTHSGMSITCVCAYCLYSQIPNNIQIWRMSSSGPCFRFGLEIREDHSQSRLKEAIHAFGMPLVRLLAASS